MTVSKNRLGDHYLKSCYYSNPIGQFHYLDSCQYHRETIVLLHGFTGSSHDFLTLPEVILRNYRCLIPDLPGHGHTQLEDTTAFQTDAQVALLEEWLHSLEQSKIHLFGYSMGGRLALQYAVKNFLQLQSLILVSTTAGIKEEANRQERAKADEQLAQKILSSEPVDFLTQWLCQPIFQGIAERGTDFIAQEVARRLPIQRAGLANSLKYFSTGIMPSIWHKLTDIKAPTLVIAGSKDQKYLALASLLISRVPNATLKILETSHAPLIESPDLLWKHVNNFIQGE